VIEAVDRVHGKTSLSYRRICGDMDIPYATFGRWRRMVKNGTGFGHPGPKKVEPFDNEVLQGQLRSLQHGPKRSTGGVGDLQEQYAQSVSRRHLSAMVTQTRREVLGDRRRAQRRIHWRYAGVCWSIDDTEYDSRDRDNGRLFINQLRDLASGYRLPPLGGEFAIGEEIAAHLSTMFDRYGAPLFLKRDWGGNLNHSVVNDVLREYFVMPLNSPPYYPPYNGSIENAQRELKRAVAVRLVLDCPREHFEPYAVAAAHDLNHVRRRVLGGKCSCRRFFDNAKRFNRRERTDAYAWIIDAARNILTETGLTGKRNQEAAWRTAAEKWLQINGLISVLKPSHVSPYFQAKMTHE